jgi:uncharacterized membrane protein
MRVQGRLLLVVGLLVVSAATPLAYSTDYTPTRLFFTVYGDGVVSVDYSVDVDPTLVKVNVTVFGIILRDVLVVDQDGLPLDYTVSDSLMEVDSLGSVSVTMAYSTSDLTSKTGSLWIFNASTSTTSSISLPAGSTITSLSSVPLEVGTLNGNPYVSMPAGRTEVYYVIGIVGTKEHALIALRDAEAAIIAAKSKGVIVSEAETLLEQAQASFSSGKYAETEQLANDAKEEARATEAAASSAESTITSATLAISAARSEGRTSGLGDAEGLLTVAQAYYSEGDYTKAKAEAGKAYQAAQVARQEINYLIIFAVAGAAAIIVAVALVLRWRRREAEPVAEPKTKVDLQAIFDGNPGLRMDDREVLRFIAESGGEAFANEIRERFDLPRTSAWRMFRRLIGMGIVEERKIRGQSLIRISGRYRVSGA